MDVLIHDSPADRDLLMELFGLICDTINSQRKTICIASDNKPLAIVRAQFLKLNRDHLQYVLEGLKANTTRVRDMKQYNPFAHIPILQGKGSDGSSGIWLYWKHRPQ